MSGRRLALRRSIGPWSAGTLLCRRGEQDDPGVWRVSAWNDPDRRVFEIGRDDAVERRPRGGTVRPTLVRVAQPKRHKPVFATVAASTSARTSGLVRPVENAVEEALHAGRAVPSGEALIVPVGKKLLAVVQRAESPVSGRKAFLIVGVRKAA